MKQYVLMKENPSCLRFPNFILRGKSLYFSLTNIEKGSVLKIFTFIVYIRSNLNPKV